MVIIDNNQKQREIDTTIFYSYDECIELIQLGWWIKQVHPEYA